MVRLKPSTKIKRNKEIIFKEVEGVVYIFDPRNSTVHTLNETASFIWQSLKISRSIKELSVLMSKYFEVNKEETAKDIESFVLQYLKEELFILE